MCYILCSACCCLAPYNVLGLSVEQQVHGLSESSTMLPLEAAFQGRKGRPNSNSTLLPVSGGTFFWSKFEGSIDVSFTAFDIPQSCAFHSVTAELKNKYGVWKLCLVVSLCVNVYFWLSFCTFDVISSEKLVLYIIKYLFSYHQNLLYFVVPL